MPLLASGVGNRGAYSLSGEYRGYPIAIYDHFRGRGRGKRIWTSLTLEATFAGKREFLIESPLTKDEARFNGGAKDLILRGEAGPFRIRCLDENSMLGLPAPLVQNDWLSSKGPEHSDYRKDFLNTGKKTVSWTNPCD